MSKEEKFCFFAALLLGLLWMILLFFGVVVEAQNIPILAPGVDIRGTESDLARIRNVSDDLHVANGIDAASAEFSVGIEAASGTIHGTLVVSSGIISDSTLSVAGDSTFEDGTFSGFIGSGTTTLSNRLYVTDSNNTRHTAVIRHMGVDAGLSMLWLDALNSVGGSKAMLRITHQGNEDFNVKSNGNTGIGLLQTEHKLHIFGDGPTIQIEDDDGSNWQINMSSTNDTLRFGDQSSATAMVLYNDGGNGAVGIGENIIPQYGILTVYHDNAAIDGANNAFSIRGKSDDSAVFNIMNNATQVWLGSANGRTLVLANAGATARLDIRESSYHVFGFSGSSDAIFDSVSIRSRARINGEEFKTNIRGLDGTPITQLTRKDEPVIRQFEYNPDFGRPKRSDFANIEEWQKSLDSWQERKLIKQRAGTRKGFIVEELPQEYIDPYGDGIDVMAFLARYEEMIQNLEKRIKVLEGRVAKLEGR